MAIAVKHITDARISITSDRVIDYIGNHTVSVEFNERDHRYHIWLTAPKDGNGWELGKTLYRNKIVEPEYGKRRTVYLDPAAHAAAIDHVLRMSGAGEGFTINGAKIDQLIDDHNARIRAKQADEKAKRDAARVDLLRTRLKALALSWATTDEQEETIRATADFPAALLLQLDELFRPA